MSGRLRVHTRFGVRAVPSESREPREITVIAIAGEGKTEEQYFDGLSDAFPNSLTKTDRLEKQHKEDTKSHPNHVLDLLIERKERWQEYGVMPGEFWMVVDRDRQNVSMDQLKAIIQTCIDEGFNLALTNPAFELWLLMHLKDIKQYPEDKLLANPKKSSKAKKRFLELEIAAVLGGYNKNKIMFHRFVPGIYDAIHRAKQNETNNTKLISKPGSSVCFLVERIIKKNKQKLATT